MSGSPNRQIRSKTSSRCFFFDAAIAAYTAGMYDNIELLLHRTAQLLQRLRRICGLGLGDKLHYFAGEFVTLSWSTSLWEQAR